MRSFWLLRTRSTSCRFIVSTYNCCCACPPCEHTHTHTYRHMHTSTHAQTPEGRLSSVHRPHTFQTGQDLFRLQGDTSFFKTDPPTCSPVVAAAGGTGLLEVRKLTLASALNFTPSPTPRVHTEKSFQNSHTFAIWHRKATQRYATLPHIR